MLLNQKHLELLKKGGATTWNDWRRSHPATVPELHGADLSGVDLRNYNLSLSNLRDANLHNAPISLCVRSHRGQFKREPILPMPISQGPT